MQKRWVSSADFTNTGTAAGMALNGAEISVPSYLKRDVERWSSDSRGLALHRDIMIIVAKHDAGIQWF